MYFLIKIFCFLLVFNHVPTESSDTFIFNATSLGHSGLLITWKPNVTKLSKKSSKKDYHFKFQRYIVEGENDNRHPEFNKSAGECFSSEGQFKIYSLTESTLYEVIVKQLNVYSFESDKVISSYSVKMRTNWKSTRPPTKPHFEFIPAYFELIPAHKIPLTTGIIRWYPCGREGICNSNQETGTHFGVTVKELYNTRKASEITKEEVYSDQKDMFFWPGRLYEVIVYSVNGECKTNSDSQEIFLKPKFSQVQYVNIISLPDLSVLISWKPPKQSTHGSLFGYVVYFNIRKEIEDKIDNYLFSEDFKGLPIMPNMTLIGTDYEQHRIFDHIPEVMYTYIIVPFTRNTRKSNGIGFDYRMKYKLQLYNQDLPIAKPDFNYKFFNIDYGCRFVFQWLPCGKSFDCKYSKPGTEYSFLFQPNAALTSNVTGYGCYRGIFYQGQTYNVSLTSSIGSNFSEPVIKIFKGCQEM